MNSPTSLRSSLLLVLLVASSACRDLSFEDPEETNVGPRVQFVGLEEDQTLPLTTRVELQAEDADGVLEVELFCERAPEGAPLSLHRWRFAPYAAQVTFGACIPDGSTTPQGTTLWISATDRRGAATAEPSKLRVQIDPTVPTLAVTLPPRVQPGANVSFEITSSVELAAAPRVTIDGVVRPTTEQLPRLKWQVSFTAPGLGADLTGGTSNTLSVLQQTERALDVVIEAATPTGNAVRHEDEVLVSRVRWERTIPGRIFHTGWEDTSASFPIDERPIADAQGLWLPLKNEGFSLQWLPAWIDRPSAAIDVGSFDASNSAGRGFGRDGHALMRATTSEPPLFLVDRHGQTVSTAFRPELPGPLLRLPDRTCAQVETVGCGGLPALRCLTPADDVTGSVATNATTLVGTARMATVSGATALTAGFVDCQGTENLTGLMLSTAQSSKGIALAATSTGVRGLLPLGDSGAFLVVWSDRNVGDVAHRVDAFGVGTPYFGGNKVLLRELVVGREDGVVVLARSGTTSTLEGWLGAQQKWTVPLPALLPPVDELQYEELPALNAVAYPDGRMAYLAKTNEFGRAVVATDAELRPRWIYAYPRGTERAMLVGDSDTDLYLIDAENHVVVALSPQW